MRVYLVRRILYLTDKVDYLPVMRPEPRLIVYIGFPLGDTTAVEAFSSQLHTEKHARIYYTPPYVIPFVPRICELPYLVHFASVAAVFPGKYRRPINVWFRVRVRVV